MYKQLASVRGIVDLSPHDALEDAKAFLTEQGYTIVRHGEYALIVERHPPGDGKGHNTLNLTVAAYPQPDGGVRMDVRGNDSEGVKEQQAAWAKWSENLPKKPESETNKVVDTLPQCRKCGHNLPGNPRICPMCGENLDLPPGTRIFSSSRLMKLFFPHVLLVHEDEVEVIQPGLFKENKQRTRYEQIAQVVVRQGLFFATLVIESTGGHTMLVESMWKQPAEEARSVIQERMHIASAARTFPSASESMPIQESIPLQIRALAELKDAGIVTEAEFEAKKKDLLDRM